MENQVLVNSVKKVLALTTGGTIAGQVASEYKSRVASESDFGNFFDGVIESIKKQFGVIVELEQEPIDNIDSSDIQPDHWVKLSEKIKEEYDNYDAFLVTHGTNTMGYTAAALSFALPNLGKPVILTGSQVPVGLPGSDAILNLENALRVAATKIYNSSGTSQLNIMGVVAVFGSHIITGTRVKKSTEFDYDAFKSFSSSSIGRIGRIIEIDEKNLAKHLDYLARDSRRPAQTAEYLICENEFDISSIASLTEFPGMDSKIFQALIDRCHIEAFILRAFGAGDPSKEIIEILKELKIRRIPVVITTQAPNGNANFLVNEPGQIIRKDKLAIPAYDMSIESQTVKLAWLLAKKKKDELTYEGLCQDMVKDMRGEVDVMPGL